MTGTGLLDPDPRAPEWPAVRLISVNVALPRVIGRFRTGDPVLSAISKQPVQSATTFLDRPNLHGDRQADLTVHGGPDKAVYAYPSEHLPWWNAALGAEPPFGPGTFGENLTTAGWSEDEVLVGDVWAWGDAVLQVTQPRLPCYKLAMVTGRPELLRRLLQTGRTGWYLRVLEPGSVPIAGPIQVVTRDLARVSIAAALRVTATGAPRAEIERVAAVGALAGTWREWLLGL